MIVYDIDGGLKHYVASDATFGVETLCGKQIPVDRILPIKDDNYCSCDCEDCLDEIEKDLKKRLPKKNISGKYKSLSV